ncbi:hypothetical protein PISMIDRAFT_14856 [Pisolithus microcarpus 441]|uniref:Coatomer alpha subunit C-terminal domain-containing protein n=1 Tax=Pisolithus microcarpus 441 TaxID=765257 RepID=A0A0C9Z5Q9_9AGAM|nr:hypothetical protein BKA83DRAFT_14856 [Pisolithus microcarpus]KIK17772.1 hypothetical protein PISMIDRAFT_14856 [Pisolithus microcarpus 441]
MNGLEDQAANILEATGLTEADIDDAPSFGQSTPKPPPILTSTQNLNWPLVGVLSSALDDWAKEEESRNVIDPEGGWELDTNAAETEEQEDEFEDAVGNEDVLAGELHLRVLLELLYSIINFVPLKALFLSTYKSLHVYLSFVTSMPPVQLHARRSSSTSSTSRVLPVAVQTLTTIHAELTEGFHLVSGNKLQDARAAFRSVLQALLLVIVSSDMDTVEELNVDPLTLSKVEAMVWKDFGGIGPFPTYILLSTKKLMPPLSANPFALSVPASRCPLMRIAIPLLHGLRMFSRCHIPPLLIFWLDLIELLGFMSSLTNTLGIATLQMTSYIHILDDDTRMKVKQEVLVTLASLLSLAHGFSAQVVAPITSIDPHMMGVKCGPFDTQ